MGDGGLHARGTPVRAEDPVRVTARNAAPAGVRGVLQPGLHRRALAALLAAHRAVAAELGIVVQRGVAPDRAVLVAELVAGRHQPPVGPVLRGGLRVRADALEHHLHVVAHERVVVEPLEPVPGPLGEDRVGRAHAVHVVHDGPAADGLAGQDRDRSRLRGGEPAAVVELEVAGELELLEVRLVAVGAHLEHEHRLAGLRALGGDHSAAGAGADHARRRRTAWPTGPETSATASVFGASAGEGGGEFGPG